MAAVRQNNVAFESSLNSQLISLNFFDGQIYRTQNQNRPSLWRASFRTLQVARTQKLSAGNARPERFPAQAIRLRDRSWGKAEAPLPIRPDGKAISPDL